MNRPDDIVAYTYQAENYSPEDILEALRKGWLRRGVFVNRYDADADVEEVLDALAAYHGIDRQNESSFDSDYFPKVIFGGWL